MAQIMVFAGIGMLLMGWVMSMGMDNMPPHHTDFDNIRKMLQLIEITILTIGVIIGGAAWKYVVNTPAASNKTGAAPTSENPKVG